MILDCRRQSVVRQISLDIVTISWQYRYLDAVLDYKLTFINSMDTSLNKKKKKKKKKKDKEAVLLRKLRNMNKKQQIVSVILSILY